MGEGGKRSDRKTDTDSDAQAGGRTDRDRHTDRQVEKTDSLSDIIIVIH